MDSLTIPLTSIPERGLHIEADVAVHDLQPPDAATVPASSAHVEGTLQEVGGDYLFRGTLETTYESVCDRCLEPARQDAFIEVMWNFETDPAASLQAAGFDADEEDLKDTAVARAVTNDEIQLGPHVWEELALGAPSKFYCKEDCQGLCPVCGQNLNTNPHSHEAETAPGSESIRGLAELAKKFPQNPGGKQES